MTRQVLVLLFSLAVVAGCSRLGEAPASASAPESTEAQAQAAEASEANRFLAYEHSITIEADNDKILPMVEAAQAACRADVEDACAILQASTSSGEWPGATLKFRAKAAGIRKLIATLSTQGEVASQSTSAEDLAGPIADTAKQLAMLTDYRTRLEGLRSRPSNDLDALMKLTRELADVQSKIEDLTGSQAHMMQRVETELLNVFIRAHHSSSFMAPISDAASRFQDVLSQGISGLIIAVGYLLPWGVVLGLGAWATRAFLRWRKRRRAAA